MTNTYSAKVVTHINESVEKVDNDFDINGDIHAVEVEYLTEWESVEEQIHLLFRFYYFNGNTTLPHPSRVFSE